MRENQLSVHYTSAEATGPASNYLADDLSNSVHITLAHFSAAGSASAAPAVAVAQRALPGARDFRLGTWLLAAAVISVTTLYTICNNKWVPSFVAQTVKISKPLSADIKRRPSTTLGGTAVTDTTKASAGTVAGAAGIDGAPSGRNSASAVQGFTFPVTEMPKAARAKTSKSKKGLLVPPPPPTPWVLPPAYGFVPDAEPQQQLQQAEAQASPKTHNQAADRENTPQQLTAASGGIEATQSAALVDADQELQAALSSSLRTVGAWTR